MFSNIICPISSEKVDSHVSRLTVFINAVLMIVFMITLSPTPLFIVTLDYGIRALGYNQYSPICLVSSILVKMFGWKAKMVDKAPKVFASRLGFICAFLGSVFITLNLPVAAVVIIALFTVLAVLDSVFDYCVGCMIYHHFVFPYFKEG